MAPNGGSDRVAEIRQRLEAATPGPWEWREDHGRDIADEGWSSVRVLTAGGAVVAETAATYSYRDGERGGEINDTNAQADAALIAAAPADVAWLLSRLAVVEAERDELRAKVAKVKALIPRGVALVTTQQLLRALSGTTEGQQS